MRFATSLDHARTGRSVSILSLIGIILVPLAIAGTGLLGDGGQEAGVDRGAPMMARMAADHAAPSFDFTPGELEVSVVVDARFAAR